MPQVLHMEFDLAGSGMRFSPGDSLGLMPSNEPRLVDKLLKRLSWDASRAFAVRAADGTDSAARLLAHLRWPCTLRDALLYGCDVTSVPRSATRVLTCRQALAGGVAALPAVHLQQRPVCPRAIRTRHWFQTCCAKEGRHIAQHCCCCTCCIEPCSGHAAHTAAASMLVHAH